MTLGFYYHITATSAEGKVHLPSYLGLFLDSIAAHVDELVLLMHQAQGPDATACNYTLQSANVRWINLGLKKPAWHRALFGSSLLRKFTKEVAACDALLLRAPTPLSAAFYTVFGKKTPLIYLIVGDYVAGTPHLELPFIRKAAIYAMAIYLDRSLKKAAHNCCIVSNSREILENFRPYVESAHFIRTTTLREQDFYERADTCQNAEYQVLFTGRFDFAKGLRELLEACAMLIKQGLPLRLHLAGWEDTPGQPVVSWLEERAEALGITEFVVNHGKLKHGDALNALYRLGDIYVMPSYHEGFPRTIWEAMANNLPVIATNVGSIPHNLTDEQDALLIEAKNTEALAQAIQRLLQDAPLRQKLIVNGRQLAQEATLEIQSKKLVDIIRDYLKNKAYA